LVVALFDVALLFEVGEQGIGTEREWCGGEQRGEAIVSGIGLGGCFIVVEDEAVGGATAATTWRWQRRLFLGREWDEIPAEVAGDGALAQELRDPAVDAGGIGTAAITTCYDLSDTFQAGEDFGDGALALFLADFLIGAAEDKEDAAGDALVGIGVDDLMAEDGKIVILLGQRRVGLAAALLLDGQEAGALPVEALALLREEGLEFMPGDRAQDVVADVV